MILVFWIILTIMASILLIILGFILSACIINSRLSRMEEAEINEAKKR